MKTIWLTTITTLNYKQLLKVEILQGHVITKEIGPYQISTNLIIQMMDPLYETHQLVQNWCSLLSWAVISRLHKRQNSNFYLIALFISHRLYKVLLIFLHLFLH